MDSASDRPLLRIGDSAAAWASAITCCGPGRAATACCSGALPRRLPAVPSPRTKARIRAMQAYLAEGLPRPRRRARARRGPAPAPRARRPAAGSEPFAGSPGSGRLRRAGRAGRPRPAHRRAVPAGLLRDATLLTRRPRRALAARDGQHRRRAFRQQPHPGRLAGLARGWGSGTGRPCWPAHPASRRHPADDLRDRAHRNGWRIGYLGRTPRSKNWTGPPAPRIPTWSSSPLPSRTPSSGSARSSPHRPGALRSPSPKPAPRRRSRPRRGPGCWRVTR